MGDTIKQTVSFLDVTSSVTGFVPNTSSVVDQCFLHDVCTAGMFESKR